MLEKDSYIVITKATNGFLVSVNNDEVEDDDKEIHVFNRESELLGHISDLVKGETFEAGAQ